MGGEAVTPFVQANPKSGPSPGGENGRDLVRFRLTALEERTSKIEDRVGSIERLCERIDTKLNQMATKTEIESVKTQISKNNVVNLRWVIGGLSIACLTVVVEFFVTK